jgi:chromatin segregation and condensation protein Rec8/ScpA/Scc1 (kleisin family)
MKSDHFIENDCSKFDSLIQDTQDNLDEEIFETVDEHGTKRVREKFSLIPRNPQPRNRKVSINDLVQALQHALATKKKVLARIRPVKFVLPARKMDIMDAIREVYHKVMYYSAKDPSQKVSFTQLLPPQPARHDKVFTFVPLLQLENHEKLTLEQEKPFAEIYISLTNSNPKQS